MKSRNGLATFTTLAAQLCSVAVLGMMAVPGLAATTTFNFARLSGATNDFIPDESLNVGYFQCRGGDFCSSDLNNHQFGGNLTYSADRIGVAATGFLKENGSFGQVTVVQNKEPKYSAANKIGAGLGVDHKRGGNADDSITDKERLVLTFDHDVVLQKLILRSDGRDARWDQGSTFLFNGNNTVLGGGISGLNVVGRTFVFEYGGNNPHKFYLGGVVVSAVPEPETWGMMLLGLGALGLLVHKRRATQAV